MQATTIDIPNDNNKLYCNAFVQIGPALGPVTSAVFEKIYAVKVGEGDIRYYQLLDFVRLRFQQISSADTIPATGLEAHEWKARYKEQHPDITDDTVLTVYYFKKKSLS